jgi:hypothetical protein
LTQINDVAALEVPEAQMRDLIATVLVVGMMAATSAVQAQTYDRRYPVCVQTATSVAPGQRTVPTLLILLYPARWLPFPSNSIVQNGAALAA